MTAAALLAAGAGVSAVAACWELVAASERPSLAWARRVVAPLWTAGREGHEPTIAERRRLALVAALCALAGGWLVGGPLLAALAASAGPIAAFAVIRTRRARWRHALALQAPAVARGLSDALGAGRSVRGALAAAATAGADGPAGTELRRAAAALELGEPTLAVLERLRTRASSPAWDILVAAILLQRQAGGDLAGLLRDLAGSLEHARRLERDARGATTQARASAAIVLALPAGAAVLTELASPGFLPGLLSTPITAALATLAALLQALAGSLIWRLGRVTP